MNAAVACRLRGALASPAFRATAPRATNPELRALADPAAVLIAVTDRARAGGYPDGSAEHLRTHAGQIAFPGGRVDPGEETVEAALREAHEEILLDPAMVDVVAALDPIGPSPAMSSLRCLVSFPPTSARAARA